uniref:DUF753 domain-containing protein n=1 Tax=Steinernema glaseri TaxID=37863 RepID=A0A1I7ZAV6_9BILA
MLLLLPLLQLLLWSPLVLTGLWGNSCTRVVKIVSDDTQNYLENNGWSDSFDDVSDIQDCDDNFITRGSDPCVTVIFGDGSVIAGCSNWNSFMENMGNMCGADMTINDIQFNVQCCNYYFAGNCNADDVPKPTAPSCYCCNHDCYQPPPETYAPPPIQPYTNPPTPQRTCNQENSLSFATLQYLESTGIFLSTSSSVDITCLDDNDSCVQYFIGNGTVKGCSRDFHLKKLYNSCSQQDSGCRHVQSPFPGQEMTMCCCNGDLCNNWNLPHCYRQVSLSARVEQAMMDIFQYSNDIVRYSETCAVSSDRCVILTVNDGSVVSGCASDGPIIKTASSQCSEDGTTHLIAIERGESLCKFNMTCCSTDYCNVMQSNQQDGDSGDGGMDVVTRGASLQFGVGALLTVLALWLLD